MENMENCVDGKALFEGQVIEFKKEGYGRLIYTDGSYYEGIYVKDEMEMFGKRKFSSGNTYIGQWK